MITGAFSTKIGHPCSCFCSRSWAMKLPLSLLVGKVCYNPSSLQQSFHRCSWEYLTDEGWFVLIPFALENRVRVSCMNSAIFLLFLLFFSVCFHQFPQLSVTICAVLGLCSRSKTFPTPQKDFFFFFFNISSQTARQKWFLCSASLKVRVEQRPWSDNAAKTLFFVFFKTLISWEREIINKRKRKPHMLGWAH